MRSVEERFWSKVNKRGPRQSHMTTRCWVWIPPLSPKTGYGQFSVGRDNFLPHRYVWEMTVGHVSEGMNILHKCDVRHCVRPSHLWEGTQSENIRDMVSKGRGLIGDKNPNSKLSNSDVVTIKRRRALGEKIQDLAVEFGVCQSLISHIGTGRLHAATRTE